MCKWLSYESYSCSENIHFNHPPLHHRGEYRSMANFKNFLSFTSILFSERYEYPLCSLMNGFKISKLLSLLPKSYIFTHPQKQIHENPLSYTCIEKIILKKKENTINSVVSNDFRNADKLPCYFFIF